MRIFTGRPRNRMGIVFEEWVQIEPPKRLFAKRLPAKAYWEITRLFGVGIGSWSLVLQRHDRPTP